MDLHRNDTGSLDKVRIINGGAHEYYGEEGPYRFVVEDQSGREIWSQSRDISWVILTNPPTATETLPLSLRIPYNKSASSLIVEKNSNTILNLDIADRICELNDDCNSYCEGKEMVLACTCGDNVCQEDLSERELCPQDCSQSSDTTTDVDEQDRSDSGNVSEGVDQAEVVDSGTNTGILVIIGILALIGAVILASSKVKIEA
jgi:hypothetical protein